MGSFFRGSKTFFDDVKTFGYFKILCLRESYECIWQAVLGEFSKCIYHSGDFKNDARHSSEFGLYTKVMKQGRPCTYFLSLDF